MDNQNIYDYFEIIDLQSAIAKRALGISFPNLIPKIIRLSHDDEIVSDHRVRRKHDPHEAIVVQ